MFLPLFFTRPQFILLFTIPLFGSPLLSSMPSFDEFSFSSNSLGSSEEFGGYFSKETGWHYDSCNNSAIEPEWLKSSNNNSEQFSSSSRVQAIARYENDLLDLAPEYAYELSLRDLVDLPRVARRARESSPLEERFQKNGLKTGGKEKVKNPRSESNESGGFLLKVFFPIPWSGKKRDVGSSTSSCGSSKCGGRSTSSGSSSSRGSKKLSSAKPLMKDGVKKCAEMQQNATPSRNCSRSGKKRYGGSSTSSCGSSKCSGRSISSGSSGSGSSSSSRGSKKLSSTVSPKPLMKDGVKKCAEMQQNATLTQNRSRQQSCCYPFFLDQSKRKTKKIWR